MFNTIRDQVRNQFGFMQNSGRLFEMYIDKEDIWRIYLESFPEETRQSHNCNCCKSFLRQFAGIVSIDKNAPHSIQTLWDFEPADQEYTEAIANLRRYVATQSIQGIYLNTFQSLGTKSNMDLKRKVEWTHFHIDLPGVFVVDSVGPLQAAALADKEVFQRGLEEITPDAIQTTLDIINQGSLYRGTEFKHTLEAFQIAQNRYKTLPAALGTNFCWVSDAATPVKRLNNSAIGTLLKDLSAGRELTQAVNAFERSVMAPANYKRPTALVTPAMVTAAQAHLAELGLLGAMQRRHLDDRDLTAANALWVNRSARPVRDVFEEIKKDILVNPKTLERVEEISIEDFISRVLPGCHTVRALLENQHTGNFVSLVGPVDHQEPGLLKWNNNFSWAYSGGVADSIKQRVKDAGGDVDVWLRVSLSWYDLSDLDLHIVQPDGTDIYYGSKQGRSGGVLDVDMNVGDPVADAVENIRWKLPPSLEGTYRVCVHNFTDRGDVILSPAFEIEIEHNGQLSSFPVVRHGPQGRNTDVCQFSYSKSKGLEITGGNAKGYTSKTKWGLESGRFHNVKAVTLSPNHWDAPQGNKHYMFMLEGCKADEPVRPFLNEQLHQALDKDRKVFEVLGSKFTVASAENELSGLGFSDTQRNHLFVEVDGSFKRKLKVIF